MGLQLFFSIEGDTQMLRGLQGIDADMKDWSDEFKKTGELLKASFKGNFASSGAELGSPWAPLKPSTIADKTRRGFPLDILVRTGSMREGFRSQARPLSVVVRNIVPYFPFHQSNRPRSKLPRRVMMKLDAKRKQQIVKIFNEAVESILQKRLK